MVQALRCANLMAGLPALAAEIAARLVDKAERMSDAASGGKEFWSAVREANWQLPPNWELPQPVTPTIGLARRSLREERADPEGEHGPLCCFSLSRWKSVSHQHCQRLALTIACLSGVLQARPNFIACLAGAACETAHVLLNLL